MLRLPGARRRLRRAAARRWVVRARARLRVGGLGRMARSFVCEARRRGLGTRKQRIGPIIERLAEAHADAEIALHFGSDVELLISVMLSAQTTDVNVNRVTEKLFVKYRTPEDYLAVPVGGARAGHLPDGLLPAEDEVDPWRDADADRGVRRRGAAHDPASYCGCPASRARRRTSSRPSSATRRASSSTRTCAGSRSGSG